MKKTLAAVAALLSLNAMAASIPPETHTINGMSIHNENGVMWSRGEALYDADSNSLALVQYIKAPNGTWTKNVWMAPCDRNKTGLVRQTRGMWSNNARVYDLTAERTVVDDSAGVTAFKIALCPAGKLKLAPANAKAKAPEEVSTGRLTATIQGMPGRDPLDSTQRVITGELSGSADSTSARHYELTTTDGYYKLPAVVTPEASNTLTQIIKRKRPVKATVYMIESSGRLYLDDGKPVAITSE